MYLVVPKQAEKDLPRLESLCIRFGIGLVIFDKSEKENPKFEIRARALKSEPDYYYVNAYLKRLDERKKIELLG